MTARKKKRLPPIHPGEVLQNILSEAGLTVNALALALREKIDVTARRQSQNAEPSGQCAYDV